MRLIVLLMLAVVAMPVLASPSVDVRTDRGFYQAGDTGKIFIEIDGTEKNMEIVAEIVSPEGVIIDGAILYTDIPERMVLNPDTWQTEQILMQEDMKYIQEGIATRVIPFAVPQAAITGDYAVNVYAGETKKSTTISIIGQEAVNAILLIYLMAIIIVIGMKYYHHTDRR